MNISKRLLSVLALAAIVPLVLFAQMRLDGTPGLSIAAGTAVLRGLAVRVQGSGAGAAQLTSAQTTPPTCSASCGTTPGVVGTDTFMRVTMGATGVPASPFTVSFNGTWAAAPSCVVTPGLGTMVVGKIAIAAPTTTTTIIVTTNGTAPANADVYFIQCGGVQ